MPHHLTAEELRPFRALFYDFGRARTIRAINALAGLRKEFAGHSERLVVTLLAPMCEDCWSYRFRLFEMDDSAWEPAHINQATWRKDLQEYGATSADIRRLRHDWDDGMGPTCIRCGGTVRYDAEDVYVESVGFGEFILGTPDDFDAIPSRKASKFLRQALWLAYVKKCASCGRDLELRAVTMDHITPRRVGGDARVENLQPMCAACNKKKGGKVPPEVHT